MVQQVFVSPPDEQRAPCESCGRPHAAVPDLIATTRRRVHAGAGARLRFTLARKPIRRDLEHANVEGNLKGTIFNSPCMENATPTSAQLLNTMISIVSWIFSRIAASDGYGCAPGGTSNRVCY